MLIENKAVEISGGRIIILRSPILSEAEAVLAHRKQTAEETYFMARYPEEVNWEIEKEREFLEQMEESKEGFLLAAYLEGELVAVAMLNRYGKQYKYRHRAVFGLSVQRRAWRMGIGSILSEEVLNQAEKLGFEQVELGVYADNEVAIHIYEKVGFRKTGIVPQAFKLRDGSYRDEILMFCQVSKKNRERQSRTEEKE